MARFKVTEADSGRRADTFIASKLPEFSRSSLQGLFKTNLVTIAKKPIKSSHKLKKDQFLNVDISALTEEPKAIDIPVLYEDDEIVVMDKPAGLLTHSKGALNLEPTVASFLASKIKDKDLKGNRAGIVHRLDRGTSGLIIGAKTKDALQHLQKQFSTRKVKKTYLAVVDGHLEPPAAVIDAPIGRDPKRPQIFRVRPDGKPAQTEYQVLKNLKDRGLSLVELKPTTGRTHQIRIHMAYIGHPLVGDPAYGRADKDAPPILLHARQLEITLPGGQHQVFSSPLPPAFEEYK